MQTIQIILTLIELVKLVEKLVPEGGQGAAKLTLVRQLLEQAVGTVEAIWPQLEQVVTAFVKLANAVGTFKK